MKKSFLVLFMALLMVSCALQQTQSEPSAIMGYNPADYNKMSYEQLAKIEKNTYVDFVKDGWTLFAIISFLFGVLTWLSQRKTEKHTQNVSISAQMGRLDDLPRHFYRNLVCTISMLLKYRDEKNKDKEFYTKYPSEANMLKLQTLPETFFLDIDAINDDIFKLMHERKLLLRNYNLEVAVATEHFSRKDITEESIVNDIDNILFKPLYLIREMFKLREALEEQRSFSRRVRAEIKKTYKKFTSQQDNDNRNQQKEDSIYLENILNVVYSFTKEHFDKLKGFEALKTKEQYDMYQDIIGDKNFDKYITCGDKKGIERCYNLLFAKERKIKDSEHTEIFKWQDEKCMIDKKAFIDYFFSRIVEGKNDHPLGVIQAHDNEELFKIFNITDDSRKACVALYFDFWNSNEQQWEVKSFIYHMLKMDAVLEMPIIGMIKHS